MHFQWSPFNPTPITRNVCREKDIFLLSFIIVFSSVVFLLVVQYEKLFIIIINICCVDGKTMEHGIEICVLVVLFSKRSFIYFSFIFYLYHRSPWTNDIPNNNNNNNNNKKYVSTAVFFFLGIYGKIMIHICVFTSIECTTIPIHCVLIYFIGYTTFAYYV